MPTATKEQKVQKIRNAEYYDFQGVQDTLYTQSKADKVFRKLMPIILSGENIMLAYRNIKKNTGSHTPGVDGKTIRDLSKWQENSLITYIRARLKHYKNTVTDMTGDGIGMAFRAGARIADMEFLLCFPTALSPLAIRGSIYPYLFQILMGKWGLTPTIRDGRGEKIEVPHEVEELVKGSKMSKLVSCYYRGRRIFEGYGTPNGGVYFDYSNTPQKEKEEILARYIEYMSTWHRLGYYMGDDISEIYQRIRDNQYLEVGLSCEYSNGGIVVNEKMETNLEGLFAAGEVTSGTFGAMRAGDGLTEMLVQGYRAGISAAEYAAGSDMPIEHQSQVEEVQQRLARVWAKNPDGISPIEIRKRMEEIADYGFNYVRSGERIEKSISDLEYVEREMIPQMAVQDGTPQYNLEVLN